MTADTKVASQEKTRPQQEGTGASGAVLGQSLGHLPFRLPSSHLRPPLSLPVSEASLTHHSPFRPQHSLYPSSPQVLNSTLY